MFLGFYKVDKRHHVEALQLFIDGHGVERAAEPVVGPAHVEELGAFVGCALPVAGDDHIRASMHYLQCMCVVVDCFQGCLGNIFAGAYCTTS